MGSEDPVMEALRAERIQRALQTNPKNRSPERIEILQTKQGAKLEQIRIERSAQRLKDREDRKNRIIQLLQNR